MRSHPESRLVYADIGMIGRRINFGAPIMRELEIRSIPYLFLLDENGLMIDQGDSSLARVQRTGAR